MESRMGQDAALVFTVLKGIIEGSPDLIAAQDAGFRYIAFNQAYLAEFKKVFGVELRLGDDMREVVSHLPEELASGLEIWARSLSGETFTVIREFGTHGKEQRHYEIHCSPILGNTGAVIGAVHIARDVTEQLRAEQALRASAAEFRMFFESASGGKAQADPATGRLLRVNAKWCELTGYSSGELLGMTLADLVHPAVRDKQLELFIQARDSQAAEYSVEKPYLRKDGARLWVQATVGFLRDQAGKADRSFVVIQDITTLKRTEAERERLLAEQLLALSELETERQKLEAILQHMPAGVVMADAATERRMMINEQAALILGVGLEPGSAIGQMAHQLLKTDGMSYAYEEYPIVRTLRTGEIVCDEEMKVLFRDGKSRTVLANAVPIRNPEGRIVSGVVIFTDITERKRAEQELQQRNEWLAEADRRKDEFLAMLAHELRNPLAPIRSAVQVMRLAGTPDPALQRQRDIVDRQVTHMARLLGDLLDVSRITRGKIQFSMKPLGLADVVAHALETAMPLFEARHQSLRCQMPPGELRIMGDLDRLAQAIGNLLTNASKYTDEGGQIWLGAIQEGEQALIRVRDTGIGIAPEMLPRVFELFAQADQGLSHSQGGLGIGLTLVRSLVQMHGGSVDARSEALGKGSEFVIRLPMLVEPGQQLSQTAMAADPKASDQAA